MRGTISTLTLAAILTASISFAGDRVVARVGSEAITYRELTSAVENSPDLTRQQVLDLLIERRLVLAWAAGKDISPTDQELEQVEASIRERNNLTPEQFEEALLASGDSPVSFRANLKEQLTINKALGLALSQQVRVTSDELQRLYHEKYSARTLFEVSHILFPLEDGTPPEEEAAVRAKAEQVLKELAEGTPFQVLAARYSQDPSSADKGGHLGSFGEGELFPELEELLATLEPGETGGPVKTSAGYHILLLESKSIEEPPSFTEVRDDLEKNLMAEKERSARADWINELKEATFIEVFRDDG